MGEFSAFRSAFDYLSIISVPLICLTIVALADEIMLLVRRAVMIPKTRSRRR